MSTRPSMLFAIAAWSLQSASAADWPQWRGPDRSNVSTETGLLKQWPKDGPPLAWKADGLGDGVVPVSVAGGRVFTTGNIGADVVCTARSESDGKQLWSARLGPAAKEMSIMRWLSQSAPTVDRDRLYAVTANGDYVCLATESGKELWRKHFQKDFEGQKSGWGYCDYPLVDGDRVILTPGGEKSTVVALDRKTGDIVWKCALPGGDRTAHSVLVASELGGVRQYVNHLTRTMVGVSASDGKLLWKYDGLRVTTATTHAPIANQDTVFYASGYGAGHVLLRVSRNDDKFTAEETYKHLAKPYLAWLGSPTQVGEHILINTSPGLTCLSRKDGTDLWTERLGRCMFTIASGNLYIRTQDGRVILAAADAKGYRGLSEFTSPSKDAKQPAWTFPVVANGRMYLRDFDTLLAYDVRDPDARKSKVPDAVFVPTPLDVVQKMLELAEVKKADLIYDLGSGDGRIVIAAAKKHGCTAVGVEIDRDLVKLSKDQAQEERVESLATFEYGDLFECDFNRADVVAVYILPAMLKKLVPKFNKLKAGSRIVAHVFPIPGIKPAKVIEVTSEEDEVMRKIYLYTVPLVEDR